MAGAELNAVWPRSSVRTERASLGEKAEVFGLELLKKKKATFQNTESRIIGLHKAIK